VSEGKRVYRSTLRAEQARQTRAAVLDAATRCFLHRGYAATTMKDVAAAAGVSLPTVFAQGGKAALLLACVDRTLVGDDEEAPLLARDLFVRLAEARDKPGKLAALRDIAADRGPAVMPMLRAFEAAAAADPDLRDVWSEYESRRYADMRAMAQMFEPELRPGLDVDAAADIWWATFGLETTDRLLRDRGWSPERFADWFADAVDRLLLR
jgi:AcrR family transcriptional regulator